MGTFKQIENAEDTLEVIKSSLEDDKAEDITIIPLAGKSTLADYMVVATGRSTTHVRALAEHIVFKLKHGGFPPLSLAGLENNDWVAVDANDVLLHIFRPEVRDFYNIEDMWNRDFTANLTALDLDDTNFESNDNFLPSTGDLSEEELEGADFSAVNDPDDGEVEDAKG